MLNEYERKLMRNWKNQKEAKKTLAGELAIESADRKKRSESALNDLRQLKSGDMPSNTVTSKGKSLQELQRIEILKQYCK